MPTITEILLDVKHRPFELPQGKWVYYQEWNNALFLHWKIPVEVLKELIPKALTIDTVDGNAYVSLVAFTMQKIRPRNLPALEFISDFDEINIRTYVAHNGKKGVYFLNIEAQKLLSTLIAKTLSGLPYSKSDIKRNGNTYRASNSQKATFFEAEYQINEPLTQKSEIDLWLTERYCLYLEQNNSIYRYDIHHKEWEVNRVEVSKLNLNYNLGAFELNNHPDLFHFSKGVSVISWKKVQL